MNSMRFKINCPYCNKDQYAEPSIGQMMGMLDYGRGDCLHCLKSFNLTLFLDNDDKPVEMIAKSLFEGNDEQWS